MMFGFSQSISKDHDTICFNPRNVCEGDVHACVGGENTMKDLHALLEQFPNISSLCFHNGGENEKLFLFDAETRYSQIKYLDLSYCFYTISGEMCVNMCKKFNLSRLKVSDSMISEFGVFAEFLANNCTTTLQVLSLDSLSRYGGFSDTNWANFSEIVSGNKHIKSLSLQENWITQEGMKLMTAALEKNQTLTFLDVLNCFCKSDTFSHEIAPLEMFRENKSLLQVCVASKRLQAKLWPSQFENRNLQFTTKSIAKTIEKLISTLTTFHIPFYVLLHLLNTVLYVEQSEFLASFEGVERFKSMVKFTMLQKQWKKMQFIL